MYKPLPDSLTIHPSLIDGIGLFATEDIPAGTNLGISHVHVNGQRDNLVRTPLGGFINHSEEANCIKKKQYPNYYLVTLRDIKAGEELTLEYTFYELE